MLYYHCIIICNFETDSSSRFCNDEVSVFVGLFHFVAHSFASGHDFRQTGNFTVVRGNIKTKGKLCKPFCWGEISLLSQTALNVVIHGTQQFSTQQDVPPRGTKVQRSSLWPRTPPFHSRSNARVKGTARPLLICYYIIT